MSPATIRRAVSSDLDRLLVLCARYCEADSHDFDHDRAKDGFAPLLEDDQNGVVWLAEEGDNAVGYAVVTWSWSIESGGRDVLLDEIYAEPQGGGVGTSLVDHVVQDCRERGLPRVFLETESGNVSARRFYGRLGFVSEESVWMVLDL